MRVFHFNFGRDDVAEPFFVRFVNALSERGFEQKAFIQLDQPWRNALHPQTVVVERQFDPRSLDRFFMPMRMKREVRRSQPDALIAWTPGSAALLPAIDGPFRLARLDHAPDSLKSCANADILVCSAPGIADAVRNLGWERPVEVVADFPPAPRQAADAGIVNAFIELMMERGR